MLCNASLLSAHDLHGVVQYKRSKQSKSRPGDTTFSCVVLCPSVTCSGRYIMIPRSSNEDRRRLKQADMTSGKTFQIIALVRALRGT
jgi:hypothetical protein